MDNEGAEARNGRSASTQALQVDSVSLGVSGNSALIVPFTLLCVRRTSRRWVKRFVKSVIVEMKVWSERERKCGPPGALGWATQRCKVKAFCAGR